MPNDNRYDINKTRNRHPMPSGIKMWKQQPTAKFLNSVHYKTTFPIAGYLLVVLYICLSVYPYICVTAYRHSYWTTKSPNYMPYGQFKIFDLLLLNRQTDPERPGLLIKLYARCFFRVWKDSGVWNSFVAIQALKADQKLATWRRLYPFVFIHLLAGFRLFLSFSYCEDITNDYLWLRCWETRSKMLYKSLTRVQYPPRI